MVAMFGWVSLARVIASVRNLPPFRWGDLGVQDLNGHFTVEYLIDRLYEVPVPPRPSCPTIGYFPKVFQSCTNL